MKKKTPRLVSITLLAKQSEKNRLTYSSAYTTTTSRVQKSVKVGLPSSLLSICACGGACAAARAGCCSSAWRTSRTTTRTRTRSWAGAGARRRAIARASSRTGEGVGVGEGAGRAASRSATRTGARASAGSGVARASAGRLRASCRGASGTSVSTWVTCCVICEITQVSITAKKMFSQICQLN